MYAENTGASFNDSPAGRRRGPRPHAEHALGEGDRRLRRELLDELRGMLDDDELGELVEAVLERTGLPPRARIIE